MEAVYSTLSCALPAGGETSRSPRLYGEFRYHWDGVELRKNGKDL